MCYLTKPIQRKTYTFPPRLIFLVENLGSLQYNLFLYNGNCHFPRPSLEGGFFTSRSQKAQNLNYSPLRNHHWIQDLLQMSFRDHLDGTRFVELNVYHDPLFRHASEKLLKSIGESAEFPSSIQDGFELLPSKRWRFPCSPVTTFSHDQPIPICHDDHITKSQTGQPQISYHRPPYLLPHPWSQSHVALLGAELWWGYLLRRSYSWSWESGILLSPKS